MSLGGGVEPTLHLPVPEIQLLGVTQEEWNEDEEILAEEEEGEEGEGFSLFNFGIELIKI